MSVEVSMDSVKKNLEEILANLPPGDIATLIGPEGKPMAVLVPLIPSEIKPKEVDWDLEWQALAHEIDSAWKSKKSALDILAEIRR